MRRDRLADLDGFRHRDTNRQNRAGPVAAVARLDMPALRLDETAADRQTQAGAGATPVLRLHAIEFIEDPLEIARRDPRALVGHFQGNDIAIAAGPQID